LARDPFPWMRLFSGAASAVRLNRPPYNRLDYVTAALQPKTPHPTGTRASRPRDHLPPDTASVTPGIRLGDLERHVEGGGVTRSLLNGFEEQVHSTAAENAVVRVSHRTSALAGVGQLCVHTIGERIVEV